MPWFPDKPKEISAGASPWPNSGHCGHGIETSTRENEKDSCGVTNHGESRSGLSPSPGEASGEDECNSAGHSTSPTILPPSSDGTVRHTKQKLSVLRGTSTLVTELQGGTHVVGQPHDRMEWDVEGDRSDHIYRLRCMMGCSVNGPEVHGPRQNAGCI